MPLDIAVLDDDFRYIKHMHLDKVIHGVLFKKLVTEKDYPYLGKAKNEAEDITIPPEDVRYLVEDIEKVEALIARESGKRLVRLGGTQKHLEAIPRRKGAL